MDAEEQAAPGMVPDGAFRRVVGAIFSPRATFESIARKPTWLVPVLLLIALQLCLVASFTYRVGWRQTEEKAQASTSSFRQLTPQQQEQRLEIAIRWAPVAGALGAIIGVPLILVIVAAVSLGVFNVIFGTSIKFSQSFAINAYGGMPGGLRFLLALLIVWVRPPQGVDIQHLVMSNVAAFMPAGAPLWQTTLGSFLDVFALWGIVLMAVGYAAASEKKVRFGGALAVLVALWLAFMLVVAGALAFLG